jgi:predicted amidophosphoribosyltransferase
MAAKPLAMWTVAFLCPVVGFFWAIMTPNQEQLAAATGEYGQLKKCPFCAESVRKEAIKCKHCGSELQSAVERAG